MSEWPAVVLAGALGLISGSFANVVIWRFPRGGSVVAPPSACPACGSPIRWHDNVPVFSWLWLRARCRDCGVRIPVRYPLVELASGALWAAAWARFGPQPTTLFAIAFFYLLLILAVIDLDTMRLPNRIVGVVAVIGAAGVLSSAMSGVPVLPLTGAGTLGHPLLAALLGSVLASGFSLVIASVYERARGRAGFGMGDVKLLAAIGPYLGPYTLLVLFVGSLLGALAGVVAAARSGRGLAARIPFGPFLALAAVIVTLCGERAWAWYLSLL